MKRRHFLQAATVACVSPKVSQAVPTLNASMLTRAIPSSGERLPVIGLGTWQTFDVGLNPEVRQRLSGVLKTLVSGGGSVVDSSPMYGRSEAVVGELAASSNVTDKLFYATKVWTRGKEAGVSGMERSMQRMKAEPMDLMQVHNLLDAEVHLDTLANWKEDKRIRYLGITHYHQGGYAEMARLMSKYPLDFIQINYSMMSREAEDRILPLAKERKIAVLINRPYEGGQLFSKVKGKEMPAWSSEIDCTSWGQYFLKFILANDAVTCVIPGTSKVHHMEDNIAAGYGVIPDAQQRRNMLDYLKL